MNAILTVNAGSSSLRAHVVDPGGLRVLDEEHVEHPADSPEAREALGALLERMTEPVAVGHRLVHGGASVVAPSLVDDDVVAALREVASIAPLHVPNSLALLDFLRDRLPGVPHVVCPDTAFHADLPEHARRYALPREWTERWGLRRFGFHGLSYAWALRRATELLERPSWELNLLIAHLSGGCSVCAVRDGHSVDTSMGFTPLEGPAMSTRSGTVDPGMLLWLLQDDRLSLDELDEGLHRRSGLLGLSGGRSGDTRDLVRAARAGDESAQLAMDVFNHRVRRELGAVAASLDRLDALVLTGDISNNQPEVAEALCAGLGVLGVGERVPLLIVEAREELQLAYETARVVNTTSG
ncbi:acetate/propionate family kinase [Qaidamihabitans albus]|uniref:acetate/propionate family kinase n=1 Tax=Qaidamihabitans albus TaxID=2795733 RepID=UPI0018F1956F|nr:acetate kinase [Qaidamihabitans albus]